MKKREAPKNCKRGSKQRRLILDTVRSGGLGHPTAAEVYDAVRGEIPNISPRDGLPESRARLASDGEISRLRPRRRLPASTATLPSTRISPAKSAARYSTSASAPPPGAGCFRPSAADFGLGVGERPVFGYCPKCSKKLQLNTKENRL